MTDEDTLPTYDEVWQLIAEVRDAAPRFVNDAATGDIVDALVNAGFLKLRDES